METATGPTAGTPAPGPIARHLAEDHARLDALLSAATPPDGGFEAGPYEAFRAGLLRHIALEEKILFPALRAGGAGAEVVALLRRLRVEHGALASLLVPTPSRALVAELRIVLGPHNAAEDAAGGLYERCDAALAGSAAALVVRMQSYPAVKVAAHADGPRVLRTAADALASSERQHGPHPHQENER